MFNSTTLKLQQSLTKPWLRSWSARKKLLLCMLMTGSVTLQSRDEGLFIVGATGVVVTGIIVSLNVALPNLLSNKLSIPSLPYFGKNRLCSAPITGQLPTALGGNIYCASFFMISTTSLVVYFGLPFSSIST